MGNSFPSLESTDMDTELEPTKADSIEFDTFMDHIDTAILDDLVCDAPKVRTSKRQPCPKQRTYPTKVTPTRTKGIFHLQLFRILSETDPSIISWNKQGTIICIFDPNRLINEIIPKYKYFRLTKFSSFQRQLKYYKFSMVKSGPTILAYQHDSFLRDKPLLIGNVTRPM